MDSRTFEEGIAALTIHARTRKEMCQSARAVGTHRARGRDS